MLVVAHGEFMNKRNEKTHYNKAKKEMQAFVREKEYTKEINMLKVQNSLWKADCQHRFNKEGGKDRLVW